MRKCVLLIPKVKSASVHSANSLGPVLGTQARNAGHPKQSTVGHLQTENSKSCWKTPLWYFQKEPQVQGKQLCLFKLMKSKYYSWFFGGSHVLKSEKAMAPHPSTLAWKIPDRGAWSTAVHGVTKSRTRLSDFTFTFMHWRRKWQPTPVFLPGESQGREPGGLPSMGLHRVGHDWSDLAACF